MGSVSTVCLTTNRTQAHSRTDKIVAAVIHVATQKVKSKWPQPPIRVSEMSDNTSFTDAVIHPKESNAHPAARLTSRQSTISSNRLPPTQVRVWLEMHGWLVSRGERWGELQQLPETLGTLMRLMMEHGMVYLGNFLCVLYIHSLENIATCENLTLCLTLPTYTIAPKNIDIWEGEPRKHYTYKLDGQGNLSEFMYRISSSLSTRKISTFNGQDFSLVGCMIALYSFQDWILMAWSWTWPSRREIHARRIEFD